MVEDLKKQLKNPDSLVSLFLGIAVVVVTAVLIFNYIKEKKSTGTQPQSENKNEQASGSATLPATYTVVAGDTLWSISQKYFASGYNWVDISDANKLTNPDSIVAGQTLTIPNVTRREPGQTSSAAVEVKKPAGGTYTVARGDSLWKIAQSVYGTGFRWTEIASANHLVHPNLIHAGNVLTLP